MIKFSCNIPAVPMMAIIKQYALSKELPFFSWSDQRMAIELYLIAARQLN